MRNAGRILMLVVLVGAPIAAAAQGTSTSSPPPPPWRVDLDVNPLVNLHTRLVDLENRMKERTPEAEVAMWWALGASGVFFAVAWGVIRTAEAKRETTLGMWKEFCQATKVGPRDDPAAALKEFASRLETVTAAYAQLGNLELRLRDLEKQARKRQ
jgi:hypothetical protein